MKQCSKCGETKALECFAPRAGALDGRRGVCRDCKRAGHKTWRDANRDHVRAEARKTAKRLYDASPEKYRAAAREWFHANREKARDMRAANYAAHAEERRAYARAYAAANPERVKEAKQAWDKAHPGKSGEYAEKARASLSDSYVKRVLFENRQATTCVPQALIEAKRLQLSIKRLIKEKSK